VLYNLDTIHEGDNHRIKDRKKALVFQNLCVSNNNTRKMIADNLKLRPITVSKIIKELIEDKLVLEGDSKERNSKGRPEICLTPDYGRFSAISIYVLSRNLIGSLLNLNGEILETYLISVPEKSCNTYISNQIRKILNLLVSKIPEESELIGIGTSLPGTVNTGRNEWISSARWPGLSNIYLGKLISEFKVPLSMFRSLDPELESLLSRYKKYRQGGTLLFHWGYGIGSAFALGGEVLKSSVGRFGEVGHWQVEPNSGRKCSCGSIGCLETEAALWAILPEIREVYPDAPQDEPEFTGFIREIEIGNMKVIKHALGYITMSLVNLYKIFYPDRILLLGPFVENNAICTELKNRFNALIPEYARLSVDLNVVSGFQGAASGSTYHLFREALRPYLRTRGNV
jgi:predicted NBD/HSP70 family sugar kinase